MDVILVVFVCLLFVVVFGVILVVVFDFEPIECPIGKFALEKGPLICSFGDNCDVGVCFECRLR